MRARILQFFRSAISLLPTLAVLGVLAVVAVIGHLTEWKISEAVKFWKTADSAAEPTTTKPESGKQSTAETSSIRFSSAEALERSGLKMEAVSKRPMSQS